MTNGASAETASGNEGMIGIFLFMGTYYSQPNLRAGCRLQVQNEGAAADG